MWRAARVDPHHGFDGVACPSRSLCVAVDDAGNVLSSRHPSGRASAWQRAHIDARPLMGVACPSVELCVSADSYGYALTATRPAAGPKAWITTFADLAPRGGWIVPTFESVACPSVLLCYASNGTGYVAALTDLTGVVASQETPVGRIDVVHGEQVFSMSCPTASFCVETTQNQLLSSSDPTGGASAWTSARLTQTRGSGGLGGVSCVATTLCVVTGGIGSAGYVWVATHPNSGQKAWTHTQVDNHQLYGPSCPSLHLCVAGDAAGNVVAVRDPLSLHGASGGGLTGSR